MIHGPTQQQGRHKAAEGAQATDDADGGARFIGENQRDDLENAAVAQSRRGADQENHQEEPGKLVRLEKARKAESADGHGPNSDRGDEARAKLVRQPATDRTHEGSDGSSP